MTTALPVRIATGFLLYLSLLVSALWLGWQVLVPLDFGYPLAHRLLDIGPHIQTFGPQNRYKPDFALTTAREQKRLFSEIVSAVQHDGAGLRDIHYTTTGGGSHRLLREAEAVHLEDVARLIDGFDRISLASLILLPLLLAFLRWRRLPPPGHRQLLLGFGVLLLALGLLLVLAGPTAVFYWLHTHIFPADHEWFFFYQDSLMTTLMKAPDLFGFIAGLWGLVALGLLLLGHWGIRRSLPAAVTPARNGAAPAA